MLPCRKGADEAHSGLGTGFACLREALLWVSDMTNAGMDPRKELDGVGTVVFLEIRRRCTFCLGLALLQSETSTGKLNKGKKSQTEQIPI